MDFVADVLRHGRKVWVLEAVDDFIRESLWQGRLGRKVKHSYSADLVIRALEILSLAGEFSSASGWTTPRVH